MARIFLPRAGSKDWSLYILWDQGFCQHSWCVWWAGVKGSTYITSIFGMTKVEDSADMVELVGQDQADSKHGWEIGYIQRG